MYLLSLFPVTLFTLLLGADYRLEIVFQFILFFNY